MRMFYLDESQDERFVLMLGQNASTKQITRG